MAFKNDKDAERGIYNFTTMHNSMLMGGVFAPQCAMNMRMQQQIVSSCKKNLKKIKKDIRNENWDSIYYEVDLDEILESIDEYTHDKIPHTYVGALLKNGETFSLDCLNIAYFIAHNFPTYKNLMSSKEGQKKFMLSNKELYPLIDFARKIPLPSNSPKSMHELPESYFSSGSIVRGPTATYVLFGDRHDSGCKKPSNLNEITGHKKFNEALVSIIQRNLLHKLYIQTAYQTLGKKCWSKVTIDGKHG
jgi:hypothetical protein